MPRFSEKAQLVWQLQEIWLACTLFDTVINDTNMLQQILSLGATYCKNHLRYHNEAYAGSSRGLLGEVEKELVGWIEWETDLGKEESGADEEEDIGEVVGILGIILSQIRYLAPRMPIPHSEYLFSHYVSNLYF